jgi:acyl CoA:acetate/3-ketoacid CoA transferase beta subunit
MGIFSFDPDSYEMILTSNHPGVSVEEIKNETGWPMCPAGQSTNPS